MGHPSLARFESKLKELFDRVDWELEGKYGSDYPLHPSRAKRGTTSNPQTNGLFNLGASFSAGFGSEIGRGYVVDVEMVTLAHVPADVREKIEEEAAARIEELLPQYFPGRDLSVSRDRNVFKIHGDIRLGSA